MRCRSASLLALALLAGCGQTIFVQPDAGPRPEDQGAADTGTSGRPDASGLDAGGPADAGPPADGGGKDASIRPDAGCIEPCFPLYDRTEGRIVVGETFRAVLPATAPVEQLDLAVARVELTRRMGLPAAVKGEIAYTAELNSMSGEVLIRVDAVPAWFSETTFEVWIEARGAGGGASTQRVAATVLGNVVFSHNNRIFAYASNGRLAGDDGFLVNGSTFVRDAEDMAMGQDGLLYVLDAGSGGARPQSVKAFELTGRNRLARTLATADEEARPLLRDGQIPQGLTVLTDGRVATAEWSFGEPEPSRVILWNPDGSHDRTHRPASGRDKVGPVGDPLDGNLWVVSTSELILLDPDNGAELETFDLGTSFVRGIQTLTSGWTYFGSTGELGMIRRDGARRMVTGLPATSSDYAHMDALGPNQLVVWGGRLARDTIVVVEGDRYLRPWLAEGVDPIISPSGLAYLD